MIPVMAMEMIKAMKAERPNVAAEFISSVVRGEFNQECLVSGSFDCRFIYLMCSGMFLNSRKFSSDGKLIGFLGFLLGKLES